MMFTPRTLGCRGAVGSLLESLLGHRGLKAKGLVNGPPGFHIEPTDEFCLV